MELVFLRIFLQTFIDTLNTTANLNFLYIIVEPWGGMRMGTKLIINSVTTMSLCFQCDYEYYVMETE